MTIPEWLAQHIATTTGAPPGARNAWPRRCPTCRAHTLRGLDGDWAALEATADPTPLDRQGEALARLTDRRTYALRLVGDRHRLTYRDRWQIQGPRNWPTPYDVLAEHQCGKPLPAVPSAFQPTTGKVTDDQPPY